MAENRMAENNLLGYTEMNLVCRNPRCAMKQGREEAEKKRFSRPHCDHGNLGKFQRPPCDRTLEVRIQGIPKCQKRIRLLLGTVLSKSCLLFF